MARSIKAEALNVGDVIYVSGKVDFSHITRKYEVGTDEFNQANVRKKMNGARPAQKSYTSLTITHPSIKTKNPDAFKYVGDEIVADTSKMTPLELYTYESMFKSKTHNDWRLTNENKGNLPQVGVMNNGTREVTLITPKGELSRGLDVLLVFNVFKTNEGKGVGLQAVISRGPIRYYSVNDTSAALADLGFTIKDERDPEPSDEQTENQKAEPTTATTTANIFEEPTETVDDSIGAVDGGDELPWG